MKGSILEVSGMYDLIVLHHSFKHMEDPLTIMTGISKRLKDDGICIIAIPLADSYAFKKYKENWVQLDAPRHFFLHSVKSMHILAEHSGLKIIDVIWDSNAFQIVGSQMYEKGTPGYTRRSAKYILKFAVLSALKYSRLSKKLNEKKIGDQAIFVIKLSNKKN